MNSSLDIQWVIKQMLHVVYAKTPAKPVITYLNIKRMFFHIYIPQIKYRYMDEYKSCGFRTLERTTLNWILIRGMN